MSFIAPISLFQNFTKARFSICITEIIALSFKSMDSE